MKRKVRVNFDQYVAIFEALQLGVRFETPCEVPEQGTMVVRDRAGRSDKTVTFVLDRSLNRPLKRWWR